MQYIRQLGEAWRTPIGQADPGGNDIEASSPELDFPWREARSRPWLR